MKKLSLKKTTLSRLNNNTLNNVKGGFHTGGCPDLVHFTDTNCEPCQVPYVTEYANQCVSKVELCFKE